MVKAIQYERFRARYVPKYPTTADEEYIGKIATWRRVEYVEFGTRANQWRCEVVNLDELNITWLVTEADLELIDEGTSDLKWRIASLLYDMVRENEDALGNRWVFHENELRRRAKELLKEM